MSNMRRVSTVQIPLQVFSLAKTFRHLVFLSAVFVFFMIVKLILIQPDSQAETVSDMLGSTESKGTDHGSAPDGLKTILLWNTFFGEEDFGVGGLGTTAFDKTDCPQRCWITTDHSKLETADAVLIHVYNMGPRLQNVTMPRRQRQSQIFVFFILESTLRSYKGFFDTPFSFKDVFNLTFTYLDSPQTDIYMPMGEVTRREEPSDRVLPDIEKVRNRSLVAWFVSNCKAPSARLEYARELAKHIPVHIYGTCGDGNFTCPPGEKKCYSNIIQTYLFYLAFENSFCQDYTTEKFYRTLTTNMVPIVYGYTNYSKLLPARSFIDVRDFASPKHLANYLRRLQDYPQKYMEYIKWRKDYTVLDENDCKAKGFCKLCSILHTKDYKYKSNYDPVEDYWNPDKLCLTGEAEKKAVHLIH